MLRQGAITAYAGGISLLMKRSSCTFTGADQNVRSGSRHGREVRKGSVDAITKYLSQHGCAPLPKAVTTIVEQHRKVWREHRS